MTYNNQFRIDFIGIGTGKSGTTWLSEILKLHPSVYISPQRKEINYFNKYLAQDYKTENFEHKKLYDWYHSFFTDKKQDQIAGDITPSYLSMENAAADIYSYNPNIKLFTILRNPVERSFSEFLFSKQNGINIYKNYEEAIEKNPLKFINTSLYYKNLQRYYSLFPAENIKVLFYEDIKADTKKFLSDTYRFLNIEDFFPEGYNEMVNVGLQAKNQWYNNLIGRAKMFIHSKGLQFLIPIIKRTGLLNRVQKEKDKNLITRTVKETINPATKEKLIRVFIEDIELLENLTGRDLSCWKK